MLTSAANRLRSGLDLSWPGTRARRPPCFQSCALACARLRSALGVSSRMSRSSTRCRARVYPDGRGGAHYRVGVSWTLEGRLQAYKSKIPSCTERHVSESSVRCSLNRRCSALGSYPPPGSKGHGLSPNHILTRSCRFPASSKSQWTSDIVTGHLRRRSFSVAGRAEAVRQGHDCDDDPTVILGD